MYAWVITYQVKPGQIEERLRQAREGRGATLRKTSGARGRVILVDPVSHKNMTIALFETEKEMQAVDKDEQHRAAFGRIEYAAGEVTREAFEVGHHDGVPGKLARVVTSQIKPGKVEHRLGQVRSIDRIPSRTGLWSLVDRASHKNITISFWESEDALRAFERERGTQAGVSHHEHADDVVLEHFEVGHVD